MQVGDVIGGKYQLLSKLGAGGTWVMWLALDDDDGRCWAIKVVDKTCDASEDAETHRRIVDSHRADAQFAMSIGHPAFIPHVREVLEDGDSLCVVMEYVPGKVLSEAMRERGSAFEEETVIGWGIQMCDDLGYLHSLTPPILYCNLTPSNVVLQEDDILRLSFDMGVIRRLGIDSNIAAGTSRYSPPEQLGAMGVDERSDVYSLGVTLFNLVTGEAPSHFSVLPPIRDINPELSPRLERVICVATMQDPDRRWQSCQEMRHELERCRNPPNLPSRFKRHLLSFKEKLLG